jgi:hypothetical protein
MENGFWRTGANHHNIFLSQQSLLIYRDKTSPTGTAIPMVQKHRHNFHVLIAVLSKGAMSQKILPSSIRQICLIGAEGG